ncbi:DNA primase [candidate division KSB1 bacterium]|nr:DNA primase [candidate division KSB1 bacterium]
MSGKIPQEKLEQIREATDIVEVISRYLTLTKKGQNFFGLCPFHSEKTPSFSVNPGKQIFYCFGCGKGGNVFTFLMEHEKLNFLEAVRFLAQKAGIPLEQDARASAQYQEKEALYFVMRLVARFFYSILTVTPAGQVGLNYLVGRKLTPASIKTFGLGFALNQWDGLIQLAGKKNIELAQLEKCGLIIPRKDASGFYDRFRERVMFPIFDASGRVVAFGGRRLKEDNTPKYINSPETLIYQKRETLYGLAQSRQHIQAENAAIMVEGYLDLISLFQGGIQNVVATSGTSLTPEHAKLIARYTKNVALLYDGDSAGSRAALRGLDILLAHDLEVKVARLPQGHDPDTFIKSQGVEPLRSLVRGASPLVEFKVKMLAESEDITTAAGKAKVIHSVLDSVMQIKDQIKQQVTLREMAERFFLDERVLLEELDQLKKRGAPAIKSGSGSPRVESGAKAPTAQRKRTLTDIAESNLTKALLRSPEVANLVFANLELQKVRHPILREIIEILYLLHRDQKVVDQNKLLSYFNDPRVTAFIASAMSATAEFKEDRKLAWDCMVEIELREKTERFEQLQQRIRELASQNADTTQALQELQAIEAEIRALRQKKLDV